ncbi:MAG: hypothetical protein GX594_17805, partial [Pirellulaceae bacterium]|nr:hypothetical protein [Pirellulaceae bacterium]
MNVAWEPSEDLVGLIESLCAGEISPDQFARLSDMILSDPSARRYYVRYLRVHANLPRILHPADVLEGKRKGERFAECEFGVRQPFGASVSGPLFDPFGQSAAVVPDMVGAEQGDAIFRPSPPPRTSPFVFDVGEHAFSYMVATVFVCLMLLGFWAYKISPDDDASIADNNSRRSTTSGEESIQVSPAPAIVGRITGIVGAKWFDDPDYLPPLGVNVRLGRQYKLKSGLLEITYDSGAKVILEGPCSYEVESTRGGYLSLGKLVARVGAGDEGRGAGEVASGQWPVASMKDEGGRMKDEASLAASHSPLATNASPLFTVRTPTALVTDLGTEFGVWVAKNGYTTSQVFAGSVRLAVMGSQADGSNVEQVLHSGQICRVEQDCIKVAEPDENAAMQFVRELPEREELQEVQLVGRIDYSDTWTANTPDRSGGFVPLESPEALRVERCHGNPPRSWILSSPVAVTTWPGGARSGAWPGFTPRGSKSGFTELSGLHGVCYLGLEYGLRDDFTVQFDAVQTDDRINVTVGDEPATIEGARSLSVFFRAPGGSYPEIG